MMMKDAMEEVNQVKRVVGTVCIYECYVVWCVLYRGSGEKEIRVEREREGLENRGGDINGG